MLRYPIQFSLLCSMDTKARLGPYLRILRRRRLYAPQFSAAVHH